MSQRKVSLSVYMNNKYTWRLLWNYENITFWGYLFRGFKNCFHATWLTNQSNQAANHKLRDHTESFRKNNLSATQKHTPPLWNFNHTIYF
jgi:hypothetical protein